MFEVGDIVLITTPDSISATPARIVQDNFGVFDIRISGDLDGPPKRMSQSETRWYVEGQPDTTVNQWIPQKIQPLPILLTILGQISDDLDLLRVLLLIDPGIVPDYFWQSRMSVIENPPQQTWKQFYFKQTLHSSGYTLNQSGLFDGPASAAARGDVPFLAQLRSYGLIQYNPPDDRYFSLLEIDLENVHPEVYRWLIREVLKVNPDDLFRVMTENILNRTIDVEPSSITNDGTAYTNINYPIERRAELFEILMSLWGNTHISFLNIAIMTAFELKDITFLQYLQKKYDRDLFLNLDDYIAYITSAPGYMSLPEDMEFLDKLKLAGYYPQVYHFDTNSKIIWTWLLNNNLRPSPQQLDNAYELEFGYGDFVGSPHMLFLISNQLYASEKALKFPSNDPEKVRQYIDLVNMFNRSTRV